ncbi:MAG TPA: hypothetical protein PKA80_14910 [Ignavibacteriaceae bacterium]|nr:hypothetical protein [Ignavibacteriaceae bacterium]
MNFNNLFKCFVIVLITMPVLSFSQDDLKKLSSSYNLDGVFGGGGGNYYFRQLGNEVLWYGEEVAVSPTWSNVAHGIIKGNIITVKWADVPKGEIMQSGSLVIQINSNDELILLEQTGEFFATDSWLRLP